MQQIKKLLALALALVMVVAMAAPASADGDKWHEEETDDGWIKVTNEGGKTLGYSPDSGVSLIEEDGYAFKDLNRDGALQPYEDWRLDNETRARDLADRLSVEEMTPLFTHGGWMSFGTEIEGSDLEYIEGGGRGGVTRSAANAGNTGMAVDWINALQALCEATGSWGIPATVSVDPCNISNTIDQLALGATFDVDTAFALGVAHGRMYRAVGITMLLGPQIDLATTPVLARTAGTYTEDPALSRDLADAYISGLQSTWAEDGSDLGWGVDSVYAIAKHYVGAGAAEGGRNDHNSDAKYDVFPNNNLEQHLIGFFDGAFHLTRSSTGMAAGVMTNYAMTYSEDGKYGDNVAGIYSAYKLGLLDEIGWDGIIVSDWQVIGDGERIWDMEDKTTAERHAIVYQLGITQTGGSSDIESPLAAFALLTEQLGEEEALKVYRECAKDLFVSQINCGLFDNPYIDYETAQEYGYNGIEFVENAEAMHAKTIIMLKNEGNLIAPADGSEKTVYIPYTFVAATEGNSSQAGTPAKWEPCADLEAAGKYYNVVTDTVGEPSGEPDADGNATYTENDIIRASAEELAKCDFAVVFMSAPKQDGAKNEEGKMIGGNLQYHGYTPTKAREVSIAGDNGENWSWNGNPVGDDSNIADLYMLESVKASVECPVVVVMAAGAPMVMSEVEPLADVILLSYSGAGFNGKWFFTEALLNVLSGQAEPSGLLNYQQPISMEEVEKQQEDLPRDCACYVDADGNPYDFAFGLNWSGVIDDARTQTYKVDPLTKLASFKFHKAETKKNTEKAETAAVVTEAPVAEDTTVPAATEVAEAPAPNDAETANAEPEAAAPAETEAEPETDDAEANGQGSKLVDVLMNVLAPVFISMGAETSQVRPYLEKCVPHITALLIALGVMIVLLIAAHWLAKKGTRHVIRWSAVLAFVLALVMIVNLICYGPMKSIVSDVLNASKAEISEEVALGSRSVIQQVGEEGMVLVKNEGLLPLSSDTSKLNLFGWASVHPVFSGTGSAASGDAGKPVDILESLSMAGYATNDELNKLYADYWTALYSGSRPVINMQTQDWTLPEPTTEYYTESLLKSAKDFSDVAVLVFARSGGENADLPGDMHAVINGTFDVSKSGLVQENVATNYSYTGAVFYNNCEDPNCSRKYDEFAEGEHYLQLSQTERDLVETVTANFDKVVVVINANNAMELGWINDYPQIGAVILAPGTGASETVTLTVPLEDMASFDSSCVKTANGGYVLEAGEYVMSVRSDSHTVLDSRSFTLDADIDYSASGRPSDAETAVNRFGYMESDHEILSRKDHFANYAKAVAEPEAAEYELSKDDIKEIRAISVVKYKPEDYDDPNDQMPVTGAKNGLTLTNLAGKSYDDPDWEKLLDQLSIADMVNLINVGGWQTVEVKSVGKVATSDCDGPSGLSNYVTGSNGTQFPTEVLMAQTWNKELARDIGAAMGQEFADANNFGWYGPAMNLHRSAFSGRNFEYFSEDAVLSGRFASEEVNGAAKLGVYAYIKHFAANDQETNRLAFLTTWMTEQCFRENCLKPFEIVVKNFDFDHYALGVMTSYNWLGLIPVISNHELLTDVLRGEWGFKGVVISDYNGGYGYQITDAAIRAGNDLMLGYGVSTGTALTDTTAATCVLAMRQACKNILYTVGNSGYYAEAAAAVHEQRDQAAAAAAAAGQSSLSKMDKLFIGVDVATGVVVLGLEALVLLRWLKKRKASAK